MLLAAFKAVIRRCSCFGGWQRLSTRGLRLALVSGGGVWSVIMPFDRILERSPQEAAPRAGAPLRIALFSGNYNYVRDGANLALNRLVAYLMRQGAEVLVFSPTAKQPAFEPAGELISIPSIPFPGRSEYRLGLGLPEFAKRRLIAFQPDIVHLSAPDFLGWRAAKFAVKQGWPLVASVHTRFDAYFKYYGLQALLGWSQGYLRDFYGRCRQIYVPSQSMIEALEQDGVYGDMRVWARGVDAEAYSPVHRSEELRRQWGVDASRPAVTFVSRLVTEKGLDCLVEAYRRLSAAGVSYRPIIVGDGPERASLEERLPDAVFTGFLSGAALAQAYASSDLFFFPSATETFGNVTLEAMASGLPAVCANATGSRSLVLDGLTGALCPVGDVSAFVEALTRLLAEPGQRVRMGVAARERALQFSWDAQLATVYAAYREIVPAQA
jgi:glycosyltransferase involved in cell wall biosynthesis